MKALAVLRLSHVGCCSAREQISARHLRTKSANPRNGTASRENCVFQHVFLADDAESVIVHLEPIDGRAALRNGTSHVGCALARSRRTAPRRLGITSTVGRRRRRCATRLPEDGPNSASRPSCGPQGCPLFRRPVLDCLVGAAQSFVGLKGLTL